MWLSLPRRRLERESGSKPGRSVVLVVLIWLALLGTQPARAADDLTPLGDEFNNPASLGSWNRIYQTEGWGNNVLEQIAIDGPRPGHLFMLPFTSSWYAEWRGELTYKLISGDFVITTEVEPRNRAGTGPPGSEYSLAGIMVRAPRSMTTPAQWTPNGQNYVFLSLGAANNPGQYQFEVKTTSNSVSTLYISNGVPRSIIQVARIGPHLIMLRRTPGAPWQVHRRYFRPDMPATLQAGLTVYTDWPVCQSVGYGQHNIVVLTNGAMLPGGGTVSGCNPDLAAAFDYVRYARPIVPAQLATANLSDPAAVSDAQLLAFLGDAPNQPSVPLRLHLPAPGTGNGTWVHVDYANGRPLELHRLTNVEVHVRTGLEELISAWSPVSGSLSFSNGSARILDPTPPEPRRFYRALERP